MVVATIPSTPQTINVPKRKYDLLFRCNKPGYQEATFLNHSGVTAVIAGNIAADVLLTAGLSSVVDSADGADNKYDSAVNITLLPLSNAMPAPAVTAAVVVTPATNAGPGAAGPSSASVGSQRQCTREEVTQKRIAIQNGYSLIPNCQ